MKTVTYTLEIILNETGFQEDELNEFIKHEIISPFDEKHLLFDEEDLTRLKLVRELKENCDPNFEALEVILYLVDQINFLQRKNE